MPPQLTSPIFIIAFTGHRPKLNTPGRSEAELEATRPLIRDALTTFQSKAQEVGGEIHLHSSAAEGADLIACEVAQAFAAPIPVHLILPLPESELKKDFLDPETGEPNPAWPRAKALIDSCRVGTHGNTLRIANSTHERPSSSPINGPDCYADANFQMLAHADALLAVKTESSSTTAGGSARFWDDAAARQLPRILINPATAQVSPPQDLDQLTNLDHESNGLALVNLLQGSLPDSSPTDEPTTLAKAYYLFDQAANNYSQQTRTNLRQTITLHGSASFLAAIGLSYALAHGPAYKEVLFVLVLLEVFLIGYAEYLHSRAHRKHLGHTWLDLRFAAETLRMLMNTATLSDPLHTLLDEHRPQWRRFALSFKLLASNRPTTTQTLAEQKESYLKNRIQDQIDYFRRQVNKATPASQRAHRLMRASAIAALIAVSIACVFKGLALKSYDAHHHFSLLTFLKNFFLYLLPVALPLLAGILLALRHSFDLGRRQHRYKHMVQLLEASKTNLAAAHTPHAFQQVITQVEETLLDERIEFDTAQRVGLEH